jgi:hypothetical protein
MINYIVYSEHGIFFLFKNKFKELMSLPAFEMRCCDRNEILKSTEFFSQFSHFLLNPQNFSHQIVAAMLKN